MNYEPTFTNRYNQRRILVIDKKQPVTGNDGGVIGTIVLGTLFIIAMFLIAI
jgi:hypothetical protein